MDKPNESTTDDFSQVISDCYNNLTKSEKSIANYLRKNQEESAFLSAAELAQQLDLSEATLVRFARNAWIFQLPCHAYSPPGILSPQSNTFGPVAWKIG